MAISAGDVTLVFKGDTADLNAAFESVPSNAQKSFGEASAFVTQFNEELDATGENVKFAGEKILSLSDAFRTLGLAGPDLLKRKLDDATNAFETLQAAGVTAKGTLLEASIKVTEREIAYQRALGESTVALNAELIALKEESAALNGVLTAKERAAAATIGLARAEEAGAVVTKDAAVATELLTASYEELKTALFTFLEVDFFVHFLEKAADSLHEIRDLSEATGIAAKEIVGFKNAMQEAGDNTDKLGTQLAKVASGLVLAEEGSKKQKEAFKALGVQFDETTGKAPPLMDALLQISDHLHETEASGDTLGLAYKALGRNSVELVAFLSQGSAAIQEQMGHYKELGDQVEKTISTGAQFQALQHQTATDMETLLLPAFRFLVENLKYTAERITELRGVLQNFGRGIALALELLVDLGEGMVGFAKATATLDFSDFEKNFKKTITTMRDDVSLAAIDMEETTKKAAADAAKFMANIPPPPHPTGPPQGLPDTSASSKVIEEAQRAMNAQLASIETWKAQVHLAFATGMADAAEWQAAQVRAAAAADAAHEKYFDDLIVGYRKAGDLNKEQAAMQEANTMTIKDAAKETDAFSAAIEKHHEATQKIFQDWQNLQNRNIDKAFEAATKAAERLVIEENKLHEAQTKLAEVRTNINYQKQLDQIQNLAAQGILNEQEVADATKQIYQQEEADNLAHLDVLMQQQQKAADDAQAALAAAKDNPLFSNAQVDDLQTNLDRALIAITNTQAKIEETQAAADAKVQSLDRTMLKQATSSWQGFFQAVLRGSLTAGQALKSFGTLFADSIGQAVNAAVMGQKSFADAMKDMAKSFMAALAQVATVEGLHQIAKAFAALADPFTAHLAPGFFLAAAKMFAVAAAAGIAGAAIPSSSGGGGGGGSPAAPANLPPTPATTPQTAAGGTNAPRLGGGGLVSQPTLAVVGDSLSRSGAAGREAVLPLDDSRAMDSIAGAVAERLRSDIALPSPPDFFAGLRAAFGENFFPVQHIHVKGDLIDHNQLTKKLSRDVTRGKSRLVSSNAFRVTRKA